MFINDIFYSLQGEGKLAGTPSAFVRTGRCNLRCVWCDTPQTSWRPIGEETCVDAIMERVADFSTKYVVITGGEPMIDPQVTELTRRLADAHYHITIETAGTVFADVVCHLASISPKLSNSTPYAREGGKFAEAHERNRIHIETIRRLMGFEDYQLKFVVASPDDLREIDELLERLGACDPADVLLMPEGVTVAELDARATWLVPLCKRRGFRFCPRLHIHLFGNTPGT